MPSKKISYAEAKEAISKGIENEGMIWMDECASMKRITESLKKHKPKKWYLKIWYRLSRKYRAAIFEKQHEEICGKKRVNYIVSWEKQKGEKQ